MKDEPDKLPRCSQCGLCCRAPVVLITKPSDYKRWVKQGRDDILKYASVPPVKGYGDFWMDIQGTEESVFCPFIRKTGEDTYTCSIQDTKPEVCKRFYCEWSYDSGKKGIPFRTDRGWTDRAKKLGYGQPRKKNNNEEQ